jgi:UDP-glucuronate 4-epimerase
MSQKRVLITGAAGFIGFHAAKALHAQGAFCVGVDNFNAYYDPELKKRRASELAKLGMTVHHGDITDKAFLNELLEKNECSHFLHLAAQAGVRYAAENPDAYLKSNLEGFLSVLEVIRKNPKVKLVYASSSSVYGCNVKIPFSVTDRTDLPANLYAATKKANELMAYSYHHLYGIQAIGLRFFTVYGPWGRPDMAYYLFTDAILQKKPIRLFNFGKMRRDFTYIDDAIDGVLSALDYEAGYDLFNIGNNTPEPLLKMVEIIEKTLGMTAIKEFQGESKGEVEVTYSDIDYTKEKLGFSPKTSLEKGLPQFISWYLGK